PRAHALQCTASMSWQSRPYDGQPKPHLRRTDLRRCRIRRDDAQAAALFFTAPISAVRIAPPAPPAIACDTIPLTLGLPDCQAMILDGNTSVAPCAAAQQPPTRKMMIQMLARAKVGVDFPAASPRSAPEARLIKICSMEISPSLDPRRGIRRLNDERGG